MASRRARRVGKQVRQCALRARSDCDEGRACCNVQNAPFLPRVARVSPTRRARDVRVAVRAGCGGGATHRPVSAQLCADSRWRVGGANCGGVGRASYVRSLHTTKHIARQQNHESNLRATQLPHKRRKPSPHTPPSPLKWLHLSHTPQNGAVDALAGIPQGIARQPKFFPSSVWRMVFGLAISLPWRSSACRSRIYSLSLHCERFYPLSFHGSFLCGKML